MGHAERCFTSRDWIQYIWDDTKLVIQPTGYQYDDLPSDKLDDPKHSLNPQELRDPNTQTPEIPEEFPDPDIIPAQSLHDSQSEHDRHSDVTQLEVPEPSTGIG